MHSPRPAFSQNNIPVIFCTDGRFLPYTAVALSSLADAARDGYNYDLFIVSAEDIPSEAQNRLRAVLGAKENISLRFVLTGNMRGLLPSCPLVRENYTLPTYYRLLLPRLFANYDKVIYADGDVFFMRGVHELYALPLPPNCVLAASPDVQPYAGDENARRRFAAYVRGLGLGAASQYANAGILLWDLKAFRAQRLDEKLSEVLHSLCRPLFMDQDILNAALAGKIYPLPLAYNFFAQEPDIRPPFDAEAETYLRARREAAQNPAVIHYAGFAKPWFYPHMAYAAAWWQTAAQTPFYDEILARLRAHDRRMQRQWANAALAAKLYFYKIMNKLSGGRCEDKILHVSDRLDMNNYWRKNRFKKQEEDL